ncbi:phytoene/squalene synthase family protein [Methylopila turkensis]|uniref:Phytoene synthase n=1 Tax=Methylopila turkensis TaxID=1437816 RepID=A0A9W6JM00_9HYPH|nr:phytoene/squalene synthase family protein [Methylopila turkensis]GLK78275.1 phytoene synthase [Methylopila turkensis]
MARPSSTEHVSDLQACAAILRAGSKSFDAAARLLPARVRGPATALYAFCRVADDAIDCDASPLRLARLHERLDRAYAGRPEPTPVDRAFSAVVIARRIPRAIPDALLEGFAWDAENRRYQTFEQLEAYAVRVAGTVGLMMALVMGVRSEEARARAVDLGVAMQLTNIARDVGEDARNGRLYLPLDWLAEAGVDADAFLARPAFGPGVERIVRRLLSVADVHYARADHGIVALPFDCRPAIAAARSIYSGIGTAIARVGFDSVTRRAVVSRPAKVWRLLAATASSVAPMRSAGVWPPVASARPLLGAVAAVAEREVVPPDFGERVGAVAEAFARLERQTLGGVIEAR